MSDEIRVNRVQTSSTQSPQPMASADHSRPVEPESAQPAASKMPWIILGVMVVVLIVLGILFRGQLFKSESQPAGTAVTVGASGYQAVFLTNGQVYFGKMSNADGDYPVLTDIYYLQVVQPPLQGQQSGTTAQTAQQQISLVKLGNELHGPVDEMHISKQQILFYEDLKTDGQVMKAIVAYKANPTAGQAPEINATTTK